MRCGNTWVPFLLNSNRRLHSLGTAFPLTEGAVNVHLRAACNARLAKYSLGPRETRVACDTLPDVLDSNSNLYRNRSGYCIPRRLGYVR